jgi:hypothetical protein
VDGIIEDNIGIMDWVLLSRENAKRVALEVGCPEKNDVGRLSAIIQNLNGTRETARERGIVTCRG